MQRDYSLCRHLQPHLSSAYLLHRIGRTSCVPPSQIAHLRNSRMYLSSPCLISVADRCNTHHTKEAAELVQTSESGIVTTIVHHNRKCRTRIHAPVARFVQASFSMMLCIHNDSGSPPLPHTHTTHTHARTQRMIHTHLEKLETYRSMLWEAGCTHRRHCSIAGTFELRLNQN